MFSIARAAVVSGAALAVAGAVGGCAAAAHTSPVAAAKALAAPAPSSASPSPNTSTPAPSPSTSAPKTSAPAVAPPVTKTSTPAPAGPTPRSAAPSPDPCSAAAVACVSLSRQEAWFVRDGHIVIGPIRVATGRPGYGTELGTFHVYRKNRMWYSTIYNNAPMPWSVFFDGGEAFHEDSVYIMSHGCVHISSTYAQEVYNFLQIGDEVQVVR
jgi:lipoprotein-anchoring transpeptidase ErfK/SrfK